MTRRVNLIRLVVLLVLVGTLEALVRTGAISRQVVLPPSEMAVAMVQLLVSGAENANIIRTLLCVLASVASAVVVGFAAGAFIHRFTRLRQSLDPFFSTYYAVPFFIFYPMLIAIFGLSVMPIIVTGFAFAVVAVTISTINALDRVPRVVGKVARMYRMNAVEAVLRLRLPAAAPYLFGGLKLAIAYSFIGVIACEFILAPAGLGSAIAFAYNDFDSRTMYGLTLLVTVIVVTINMYIHGWEQKLSRRWGTQ